MSPLAFAIFLILRSRVPHVDGRISYSDMIALLPAEHDIRAANDYRLNPAYSEILEACRRAELPPLTAILVQVDEAGRLTQPGPGYFRFLYPQMDEVEALVQWGRDLEAARRTQYPAQLP